MLFKGLLKPKDEEPCISGLEYYWEAWRELSTCRPVGMGLGPIPFTAMKEYFDIYPSGEFVEFHYIMRRLDDSFLLMEEDKKKKEAPPKKT